MLKSIKIENFKCFKSSTIYLDNYTIFVGANGAGKSSIIQSILLAKQSIERLDSKSEIFLNGPYMVELGQFKDILCSEASSKEISIEIKNENSECQEFILTESLNYTKHLASYRVIKGKKPILDDDFVYINAERIGPRKALNNGNSSENIDVGHRGEYTAYAISLADTIKVSIDADLKLDKTSSRFSSQVEAWLRYIIPNISLNYKDIEDLNMVSIKYKNQLHDTDFIPATNTGFGISYVLPIIVSALNLAYKKSGILIIENPEAHLHPYSQSRLGKFLGLISNYGTQVIVETHSEHIVNGARIEMTKHKKNNELIINYLTSNSSYMSEIIEIKCNEYGELSKWPNGFFDQEQEDLKELFLLRRGRL
ncbi:MAG: DUF3696 domain-containing protein [Paraclostridium sp.]